MISSEWLKRIVTILSISAWTILGLAITRSTLSIFQPASRPAVEGVLTGGVIFFVLIQGLAWILARSSGNPKGADGLLSLRMFRRPRGLSTEQNPLAPTPEPSGVGGFLWVPIIGLIVVGPLAAIIHTLMSLRETENLYPALLNLSAWANYKMAGWSLIAIACALSMTAGGRLLFDIRPQSVRFAVWVIWLRGPLMIVADAALASTFLDVEPGQYFRDAQAVRGLIGSILSAMLWTLYFKFSRRVRNTYRSSPDAASAGQQ